MAPPNAPAAALLIVDVQEDFCEPNGSLALPGGRELATPINKLLASPGFKLKLAARDFHPRNHVSFASQHEGAIPFTSETTITNPENAAESITSKVYHDHCVQGTPGCEIIPELHTSQLNAIINKGTDAHLESYSAFGPPFRNPRVRATPLHAMLQDAGITHVFCVGLSYNVCVFYSALDAAELGYRTFVIRDATASRLDAEGLRATREALERGGVRVVEMGDVELDFARVDG